MAGTGELTVYETLMRLQPDGLKPGTWAARAGLARNYFNNLSEHSNPKNDTLDKLLKAINVSRAQFDAARHPVRSEVRGTGSVGTGEVRREFYGEDPLPDLALLGTAVGGEYGDLDEHIELTEIHLGEVIEYLTRPASLAHDTDAYALTIVGDSMQPRFKPGERVAVSPRSSVGIGDDVIVQLRGQDGEDERIKFVLIKELVRRGSSYVELKQYNPEITFRIEAQRVASMHKVRGNFF